MLKKNALFAGTFEFFHEGHIDVLMQAMEMFAKVYVAVGYNPFKDSAPIAERFANVQAVVAKLNLANVEVIQNNGFGVVCAQHHQCHYLVRGIRDLKDAQDEILLASRNYDLAPQIRTIFIMARNDLKKCSSSNLLAKVKQNKQV